MSSLLLHHIHTLATFDDERRRLHDAWVLIRANRIEAMGTGNVPVPTVDQKFDLTGRVVLPGLVNTHHHQFQSLLRNIPSMQDSSLFPWIRDLCRLMSEFTDTDLYTASLLNHAGLLIGLLHGFFTITLRSNQIVSAVALNLFALAATALGFRLLYASGVFVSAPGFEALHFPILGDLPYLGTALFTHNIIIYLGLLLIPLMWFILYRTSWGLTLRAVGEYPVAASTVGINVNRVRYIAVILSGAISGISGSALVSASNINAFQENLSAGRGFIAFAAVIFGRWNPIGIFFGTIRGARILILDEPTAVLLPQETDECLNTTFFKQMKSGAFFIHSGGSGTVNEADLAKALKSGHLGGRRKMDTHGNQSHRTTFSSHWPRTLCAI